MKYFLIPFLIFLFLMPSHAQDKPLKLGLALSGGGAKGLAHIGVLKVLEEEGIQPDFISGTSMGSIVGGLYAIGYTAEDLEKVAKDVDWLDYFNDDVLRNYKSIEDKETSERYQFSFPVKNGKIQFPIGFIKGAKMSMLLSRLTLPVHQIENFKEFSIPFSCVATNLETGEGKIFDNCFLPDAMRASASIPTVFEPIAIKEVNYIDGMFVRNLPVEDAIEMGADLVISVDVGSPLAEGDELTSFVGVMGQAASYGMVQSTVQQQELSDVLITPELKNAGSLDFSNIDTLINRGERAARAMLPEIRALKKRMNLKEPKKKRPNIEIPSEFNITSIGFEGGEKSDRRTLIRLLKIKPPQLLGQEELTNKLISVYASGFFTYVDYRLIPEEGGYKLSVRTKESSNVYLRVGGHYNNNINAAILLNTTVRNLLLKGSRLSADVRISETPGIFVDYLIHTNTRPNVGFRIDGKWNFFPGDYYENNNLADGFNLQHASDQLGIYSGISSHSSIWLGWGTEIFVQKEVFSIKELESINLSQNYLFGEYSRDRLDRKYFPTKGYTINAKGKYILGGTLRNRIENIENQSTAENFYAQIDYRHVFSLGEQSTLIWYNNAGYSRIKQGNYINLFSLGNALPTQDHFVEFVGFDYMEQQANRYAFSGLKLQLEPALGYFFSALFNYGYYELDDFNLVQEGELFAKEGRKQRMAGVGLEAGMLVRQFGPLSLRSEYNFFTNNFNTNLKIGYAF